MAKRGTVRFSVDTSELESTLDKLETVMRKKRVLEAILRKASSPIAVRMKAFAPRDSGLLSRSITHKAIAYEKDGRAVAVIGPERKTVTINGERKNAANYAHLLEYGVAPHKIGKGLHPGHAAKPFIKPGFESGKGKALRIIEEGLKNALEGVRR